MYGFPGLPFLLRSASFQMRPPRTADGRPGAVV